MTVAPRLDDDGDGDVDCKDSDCATVDADMDGVRDCDDCAPLDPGSHSPVPEVDRLLVSRPDPLGLPQRAELSWADVRPQSGTGTVTDVFSGPIAELRQSQFTTAACLADDATGLTILDDLPAAPGAFGHWYLVRAENPCGAGTVGLGSAPRGLPATSCD